MAETIGWFGIFSGIALLESTFLIGIWVCFTLSQVLFFAVFNRFVVCQDLVLVTLILS